MDDDYRFEIGEAVLCLQRENDALRRENEALKLRSVVDAESVVLVLDMSEAPPNGDCLCKTCEPYRRARKIAEKYRQAVMA